MSLRTSLALPRRGRALELVLALGTGFTVAINAWAPGNQDVSKTLAVTGATLFAVTLFLLRRTAPAVPFLVAAALVALSPKVIGLALPAAAYAVGRYSGRWPVRVAAAVAGSLALARFGFLGSLQDVLGALASIAVALLLPGAVGAYVRTRAELMTALQERAQRAEAERELLARDAVLTERTRIAREMHDAVGHRVSLMVLQAGAIEMAAADRQRVEQLAAQVQTAGRQALEELRQAVGVLRSGDDESAPPLAPQPGLDHLDRLVADWRAAGMDVRLDGPEPEAEPVDPVVSRAAYRIVQEALTNAGKHAPGAPVAVQVERSAECVRLRIINGAGAQPAEVGVGGGYGLVGLGERVRTLGGRLTAQPRLDGGFMVEAELPA